MKNVKNNKKNSKKEKKIYLTKKKWKTFIRKNR